MGGGYYDRRGTSKTMIDDDAFGISRRKVLRRGAIAAGAVTVGVSGFTGSALASDCPRTPGFWANHDWCEVPIAPGSDTSVAESIGIDDGSDPCPDSEFCLGPPTVGELECKSMADWQEFLVARTNGDKGHIMAKHVLAATLNFHRRPGDDTDCVLKDVDFSEFGLSETTTVGDVAARAREWLEASDFPGDVRHWTVDVDGEEVDGEPLKNVLDAFNNAQIEELDCDCTGEE